MLDKTVRFIDLFAGIGGIRTGLSQALEDAGHTAVCVLASEIKPYATRVLQDNYPQESVVGDVTQLDTSDILILTFCVLDSLVRHFHLQANVMALPIHAARCSLRWNAY